jgi:hypothetical protein
VRTQAHELETIAPGWFDALLAPGVTLQPIDECTYSALDPADAGAIANPRTAEAVESAVRSAFGRKPEIAVQGSFTYASIDASLR